MRIRRDVVIHRLAAQDQVAHAAAHKIGFESRSVELTADLRREFARSHAAIMRSSNGEAKGIDIMLLSSCLFCVVILSAARNLSSIDTRRSHSEERTASSASPRPCRATTNLLLIGRGFNDPSRCLAIRRTELLQ